MKKFLLTLAVMLCILLTCSVAFAAELTDDDACPICGDNTLQWLPVNDEIDDYHFLFCRSCSSRITTMEKCIPTKGSATCSTPPRCKVCDFTMWLSSERNPDNHTIAVSYDVEPSPNQIFNSMDELVRYLLTTKLYATPVKKCTECKTTLEKGTTVPVKIGGDFSCTQGGTLSMTISFKESWAESVSNKTKLPPIGQHELGKAVTVEPTCTKDGYTERICTVCGKVGSRKVIPAAGLHWFGAWTANAETDGIHNAACRNNGCTHIGKAVCTGFEITVGETVLSVCPVCGKFAEAVFEVIEGASLTSATKTALPTGEAIIRGIANPFDGVLYAFTAAYEYSGESIPFGTTAAVSVPLSAEQFTAFELVRVDVTPAAEDAERTETRTAVEYTFENDILTFEADAAGLYLIVPAAQ